MDINQQNTADHIIEYLRDMEADGETLEYIITEFGMGKDMLRQLFLKASDKEITSLIEERDSVHDAGKNAHFNS